MKNHKRGFKERVLSLGLAVILAFTGMPAVEAKAAGNPIGTITLTMDFPQAGTALPVTLDAANNLSGDVTNVDIIESKIYLTDDANQTAKNGTQPQNGDNYTVYMRLKLKNAQGDYFDPETTQVRVKKTGAEGSGQKAAIEVGDEGNNKGYYLTVRYNFVTVGYATIHFVTAPAEEWGDVGIAKGNVYQAPALPTAPGYTFTGWYLDSAYQSPFISGSVINDDITLYAKSDINKYAIEYDVSESDNGNDEAHNGKFTASELSYGDAVTNPSTLGTEYNNLTKHGYSFKGWAAYHEDGTAFDAIPATMPAEKVIFKPVFQAIQYRINFVKNKEDAAFYAAGDTAFASQLTDEQLEALSGYTVDSADFDLPVLGAGGTDQFLGWYFDATDTAEEGTFSFSKENQNFFRDKNGNLNATNPESPILTLTAKWGVRKYNLTWDLGSAKADNEYTAKDPADNEVIYNTDIVFPNVMREHYELTGWTVKKSGSVNEVITTAQAASFKMPAADVTISPNWEATTYYLKYDLGKNDDDGGVVAEWHTIATDQANRPTWTEGEGSEKDRYKVTSIPVIKSEKSIHVTDANYTFGGWYASNRFEGYSTYYNQLNPTDKTVEPDLQAYVSNFSSANQDELYANWQRDEAIYEAGGWDDRDLISVIDESTAAMIAAKGNAGTLTLHARWKKNKPTLTWDFGGGEPSGEYDPEAPSDGSAENVVVGYSIKLPANVIKKGYRFNGWKFCLGETEAELNDSETKTLLQYNATARTLVMPNKKLTIKAVFEIETYTVTYDLNGKAEWKSATAWNYKDENGSTVTIPAGTEKYRINSDELILKDAAAACDITAGYEFVGWYDGTDPANANALHGIDPDTATQEDYSESVIGNKLTSIAKGSVGNKTLIAIWRRKTFIVAWNLNGGVMEDGATDARGFAPAFEYSGGKNVYKTSGRFKDALTAPNLEGLATRTGYRFAGWYLAEGYNDQGTVSGKDEELTPRHETLSETIPAHNVTAYAIWLPIQYTLTFDYDPNQGELAEGAVLPTYYTVAASTALPNLVPKEVKYTFEGWYLSKPESGESWKDEDKLDSIPKNYSPLGDMTLYARFNTRKRNLSWDFNGSSVSAESVAYTRSGTYDFGTAISYPSVTKSGYRFIGWTITAASDGDDADIVKEVRYDGDTLTIPEAYRTLTRDMSIHADFAPITYTIVYHKATNSEGVEFGDFKDADKSKVIESYTVESLTGDYTIPSHYDSSVLDKTFYGWYLGDSAPSNPLSDEAIDKKIAKISRGQVLVTEGTTVNLWAVWLDDVNYAKKVEEELATIRSMLASFETLLKNGEVTLDANTGQRLQALKNQLDGSMNMAKAKVGISETVKINQYYNDFYGENGLAAVQANKVIAAIKGIGEITYTDACKQRIDKADALYKEALSIDGVLAKVNEKMKNPKTALAALTEAKNAYAALEEKNQKDNAASAAALSKIQAIPNAVSLSAGDKATIDSAVAAYEALTADQKALVPSTAVTRMYAAANTYAAMAKTYQENQTAIKNAEAAIKLVPDNITLNDTDKAVLENAQKAYDSLTKEQKALVDQSLIAKLSRAQSGYNSLKEAADEAQYQADYKKWDKNNTSESEITARIRKTKTDSKNVSGAKYAKLKLTATGAKKSIKLKWKKVKKADGYLIYGAEYGSKMKLIATVGAKTGSWSHKKRATDTYYKYIVVAYKDVPKFDTKSVITLSETVYAAASGSKLSDVKSIGYVDNARSTLAKPGDKLLVEASVTMSNDGEPLVGVRYESSNKKVATVDKKGNIKCKKPGKALIYAIAQNGKSKTFKVLVKKES